MVDYRVRSVSLLNLVNDIRSNRLIPDAYFQRNLVWREIHNKDFIKTILMGFPFPQIFISKGKVDVKTMTTVSCIVDGQQRTNAISKFIDGHFDVEGKYYDDLDERTKSDFLKYEIAVIELDLENDDPNVLEIFKRINRTSNSLTTIEKMASEFATSEFMLVAKLLCDQISLEENPSEDFREDPNIPDDFFPWARKQKISNFVKLITKKDIFSTQDISRKAHLMHVLNIMSTLQVGFFNRNEKTIESLNDYASSFENREKIVELLESVADIILKLKLKSKSYWYNKSNIFTLIISIGNSIKDGKKLNLDLLREELNSFELAVPDDFRLAASEGVNNTKARITRNSYVEAMINRAVIP
jgi:hypothetical protein